MFEFSIAAKYLLPRRKHLSASIISLLSVGVISLVVWLVIVFFSVTSGLERIWTEKMIAMSSPVQLTPTTAYKNSYYARIDKHSLASGYRQKTIREKALAERADPYDPNIDPALPSYFPSPEEKDLVKSALSSVKDLGMHPQPFETAFGQVRFRLMRPDWHSPFDRLGSYRQQFLTQTAYLSSLNSESPQFDQVLYEPTEKDLQSLFLSLSQVTSDYAEDEPSNMGLPSQKTLEASLKEFFKIVTVNQIAVHQSGLLLPKNLYPLSGTWIGEKTADGILIPNNPSTIKKEKVTLVFNEGNPSIREPIILEGGIPFESKVNQASFATARTISDVVFDISGNIQGVRVEGSLPFSHIQFHQTDYRLPEQSNWFLSKGDNGSFELPYNSQGGYGVLVPKVLKESGVLLGDRGFLSYSSATPSGIQEQRLPIFVAGFYDPGIFPLGGRFIWVPPEISSLVVDAYEGQEGLVTQGIHVHLDNPKNAGEAKEAVMNRLREEGLLDYWRVEEYTEYPFVQPVIQQLKSERLIFSLISWIIILVACSNIISMLILLVNDKKVEIAILRAMGASSKSIAKIFGLSGLSIGVVSGLFGALIALVTLYFLNPILDFLGKLQGYALFQEGLYGSELPNTLHLPTLLWVLFWTFLLSLVSGLIPAIKAARLHPTEIFKENR